MVFGEVELGSCVAFRSRRRVWALGVLLAVCCGLCLLGAGGALADTVSFTTPGCTTWTVPVGSHFQIQASGAPGSPGGSYIYPVGPPEEVLNSGGSGGSADMVSSALVGVSAGMRLFVCVDIGGGAGGSSQGERRCEEATGHAGCFSGGAGGGASGVSLAGDFSQPVLVAGGGGGGGGLSPYGLGAPAYNGGAAGETGGGGERALGEPYKAYDDYFGGGGGGGSSAEGGLGGKEGVDGTAGSGGSQFTASGPGAGGTGGYGEYNGPCDSSPCEGGGGGGGGGGFYGGGAGAGAGIDGGGGGGGSSLVPAGGEVTLASQADEPQVLISYTPGPSAVTEAASGLAQSTATLNATVNPDGQTVSDCHFEYGPTDLYGSVAPCEPSPGSGSSAVAVSAQLVGLNPKSLYHFRIVATNEAATNYGEDRTFETLPNPPAVTSVSPDGGLDSGGISVTITGTGFAEATAVKFGTADATHFTIGSPTSITAIVPAEMPGTVAVTVANTGGTSATSEADQFTYVAPGHAPAITRLSAKKGPAAGGSTLTITGTSFVGVTAVKFGSTNATTYKVNSATSITAESPPGTAGPVEVTVTTPNGESAISGKDRFTFAAPTVTSISPDTGSTAHGTPVTITGSGFALGSATIFYFGKTSGTAVDCTSTGTCTVISPAGAKATPVEVIAKVGKAKSKKNPPADRFNY
jgi:hypothetical protein